jgi:CRP-like cAMP-binding protein
MPELLKKYITLNADIEPEKLNEISARFKPLKAQRGEVLLSQGNICNRLYFVNKGCIRVYYLTEQGQQRTRFFAFEGMLGTSLASFISQQPSFEYVDVLEDADLLYITHTDFFELANLIPEWKDFYCRLLEFGYLFNNHAVENLVTLNAKQRYDLLLSQNPRIVQRLPNKIVATYLDISPEALSRIKSA